jgi:hypothetical protein
MACTFSILSAGHWKWHEIFRRGETGQTRVWNSPEGSRYSGRMMLTSWRVVLRIVVNCYGDPHYLSWKKQQVAPWLKLFQEGRHIDYQLSPKPQFFSSLVHYLYRPSVNMNATSLKIYSPSPARFYNFIVSVR